MIYLNGREVKIGEYPNKEINIPLENMGKDTLKEESFVKFTFTNNLDLLVLGMLKKFLDSMGIKAHLYISYLPYSRMDRPNGFYVVTLDYIVDLISNMNFEAVTIREPHSEKSLEIKNSTPDWWCKEKLVKVIELSYADSILFPDRGAHLRYGDCNTELPSAIGSKIRDFSSGVLGTEYKINGTVGKRVLIVDDLCSRGGTFIRAAVELRKMGAISVNMLVAHCEQNVFTGQMFNYIDRLYTANDLPLDEHPRITKID